MDNLNPSRAVKSSKDQRLRFHIGTTEVIGRISICDKDKNGLGSPLICLIRLEESIVVSFQDNFSYLP